MNRKEYIGRLRTFLQGLPIEEIQDILSDYEEHFDIGISKGKTEEEIASELGDPREVAKGYRANYRTHKNEQRPEANNNDSTKKFLIGTLLVIANLVILFGPFMALVGIVIGAFGMGIGFTFGGIAMIFRLPFGLFVGNAYPHILTSLGFGLGLGSLGVLILILSVFIVKLLYQLISKYIKWNIELVNRGGI
jgi:uncharacterized membrane protein